MPSPVVHAGRLLAALLFGAVVFQAAQSLQVPAYEPRLVGVWALGALLHGYLVRAAAPVVLGVVAGFAWLVWSAALDEPTVLGVLLVVCAAGVGAIAVAALHDRSGPRPAGAPDLATPWRVAGAVLLLGALFTAALPFVEGDAAVWTPRLIVTLAVATLLAAAAVVLTWRTRGDQADPGRRTPSAWLAWEPLAAVGSHRAWRSCSCSGTPAPTRATSASSTGPTPPSRCSATSRSARASPPSACSATAPS